MRGRQVPHHIIVRVDRCMRAGVAVDKECMSRYAVFKLSCLAQTEDDIVLRTSVNSVEQVDARCIK